MVKSRFNRNFKGEKHAHPDLALFQVARVAWLLLELSRWRSPCGA